MPTTSFGGMPLVIITGEADIVIVYCCCAVWTGLEQLVLVAVTVKVMGPGVVGVPVRFPLRSSEIPPLGRSGDEKSYEGALEQFIPPMAPKRKLYGTPTTPFGGAPLVNITCASIAPPVTRQRQAMSE